MTQEAVLAQMKAAKDVPIWGAGGQTFTCDGTVIPIMPNVCSATFFVGRLTADGQVEDPVPVDAKALFEL
ncbi:MAG: hypothetical protein M5U14_20535 [Acidimicrobiia bacterium]|nr:hypothetical protein [Acidimicrobiia bacterium]